VRVPSLTKGASEEEEEGVCNKRKRVQRRVLKHDFS